MSKVETMNALNLSKNKQKFIFNHGFKPEHQSPVAQKISEADFLKFAL